MIPTTIHTKTQHLYPTARVTASRGYCSPVRKLKSASLRNFLYATIRKSGDIPTNRKPQAERHEGVHSTPMRHSKRARSARDLPLSTLPLARPEKAIEFLSLWALLNNQDYNQVNQKLGRAGSTTGRRTAVARIRRRRRCRRAVSVSGHDRYTHHTD